jgi:ABC-type branched-subunit amino acid transport system substrate-binding protein
MLVIFLLSTSTAAAEPIFESADLPTMGPGIPDDWVNGPKVRSWAFGLGSALENAQAFDAALKYLFKGNVKGKRVAITGDNSAFDTLILNDLKALAPKSGWTVATEKFGDFTELSWASQAADVASAKPDAIIDITIGAPTILHAKAYGTAGIKVPIVSFVGLNVASDVKGIAMPNWYMVTAGRYGGYKSGSLIPKAAAKYGTSASSEGGLYASGWATGAIVARALKLCGVGCSSSKLLSVLAKFRNYTVPGGALYGPVTFTKNDHSGVTAFGLVKYDPKTDGLADVTTLKLPQS